ncbi:MAG TPA: porin [Vicinamibacterales bacterium]|nr:porin [Vicinamibacterales bacterium]
MLRDRLRPTRRPASVSRSLGFAALLTALAVVGQPRPALAANPALLRLLQVLRDKGSISAQEYEEIRAVADAPDLPVAPTSGVPAPSSIDVEQDKAIAAVAAAVASAPAAAVSKALAGKWYERIGIRGYSQLRYADVASQSGAVLEVPADRSVNANESFMLRRGRLVFSGDVAPHLSLYAQTDFNGSPGSGDFALQMRDLYGDVWLDQAKTYRVRLGQSKVPFGWVNMQSSSNRAAMERPDALNSAVEGERDLGVALMWESPTAKQRFRELGNATLKGSGDYGVLAAGLYSGQGLNRSDQNGNPHAFVRASYPFKTKGGQFYELGVQAYRGRFVVPTQAITVGGVTFTPVQEAGGIVDERVAVSVVVYPQPLGLEAEWNVGRGPQISDDYRTITQRRLNGGYVQLDYSAQTHYGRVEPFARWNYFDGARKFGRNAPRDEVNEVDAGVEFARWAEVEITGMFTHTFRRTRTSTFPFALTRGANRVGLQVQWNY